MIFIRCELLFGRTSKACLSQKGQDVKGYIAVKKDLGKRCFRYYCHVVGQTWVGSQSIGKTMVNSLFSFLHSNPGKTKKSSTAGGAVEGGGKGVCVHLLSHVLLC